MQDEFIFTFIYNILREYGQIAPIFTKQQIKEFVYDLKSNSNLFENFIMSDGDLVLKLMMPYSDIFKESIQQGLSKYSNVIDLIQWALFCGPEHPSNLKVMTPADRQKAIHIILDNMETMLYLPQINEMLNVLLYIPSDNVLITKFLNKMPKLPITNEWLLTFLHRGNFNNIPYIVSHPLYRHIVYQNPNFLTKCLPQFRQQLLEDDSILGPNDTHSLYYNKLAEIQTCINKAKNMIRRKNWSLMYWISIFVIKVRKFLERFYEPVVGVGFKLGQTEWNACLEHSV